MPVLQGPDSDSGVLISMYPLDFTKYKYVESKKTILPFSLKVSEESSKSSHIG